MADKVQVTTKSGPLAGILKKTRLGTDYISFQKIPYAKAPLGRLRFKVEINLFKEFAFVLIPTLYFKGPRTGGPMD